MILIVMGVSGSGKTTLAKTLARLTGWQFAEGDNYHSEANRQKMHSGVPLTDEDRAPWLQTLNALLRRWDEEGINGVLACSALKAKYHEVLEVGIPLTHIQFIFLDVPKEVIAKRLALRATWPTRPVPRGIR